MMYTKPTPVIVTVSVRYAASPRREHPVPVLT